MFVQLHGGRSMPRGNKIPPMRREAAQRRQMEHKRRTEEAAGTEGAGRTADNWTLINLGRGGGVRGAQSFSDAPAEETR